MSRPNTDLNHTEAVAGNISGVYFILVSNLPNGTSPAELQSLAGNVDGCFVYPGTGDGWVRVCDHETFLSIHSRLNGLEHQGSKIQASRQNENDSVSIWESGPPQTHHEGYGDYGMISPPAGPAAETRSYVPPGYGTPYGGAAPFGYGYGNSPPPPLPPPPPPPPPPPLPGYTGYGGYPEHPGYPGYSGHTGYGVSPPPGAGGEGPWYYPPPKEYIPDGGFPPGFHPGYGQDVYYPQPQQQQKQQQKQKQQQQPQWVDDPNSEEKCKIIVKQLSRHLGKKDLITYLHKAAGGRQKLREDVRMPRWGDRTRLQHAFMVFKTHEDAAKAIQYLDKKPFHGLTVEARFVIETVLPERKAEPAVSGSGSGGGYGEDGGNAGEGSSAAGGSEAAATATTASTPVLAASTQKAEPTTYQSPLVVDGTSEYWKAEMQKQAAKEKADKK